MKRVQQKRNSGFVKIVIIGLIFFFSLPAAASAVRQRYVIDLGDTFIKGYRGNPAVLPLKRLLRERFPGIRLREMGLKRVVLIAKSKQGKGRALLQVGDGYTMKARVGGNPGDFSNCGKYTFDKIRFLNPSESSFGAWRLQLRGNFIVRKIVVVVDRERRFRNRYSDSEFFTLQFRDKLWRW